MTKSTIKRAPRWFGFLFAAFSCIFIIGGWWCAIVQDHRLRHGKPVQATVSQLEIIKHRGKFDSESSSEPRFHYQFNVAGTFYESTEVFPTYMGGQVEHELRDELYARLHEHTSTLAWYVDDEPSRAYLIHERLFGPYVMIMVADVFFLAGLVVALAPKTLSASGVDLAEFRRRRTITVTWLMIGLTALGHYLLQWPAHWHGDFVIVTPIWVIISLALIAWWRGAPKAATIRGNHHKTPTKSSR